MPNQKWCHLVCATTLLTLSVLPVAACGGNEDGASGFSSSERVAADAALRALADTSVQTAAYRYTEEVGVASACRVHIVTRDPLTFELLVTWEPVAARVAIDPIHNTYAWL